jgi:glucose-1-phosphate thymidylyltransferase
MVVKMKFIILAGGNGTRLSNFTSYTSKQLLPIYDEPMVKYPYNTLKELDINNISLICKKDFTSNFYQIFKNKVSKYLIQDEPKGLPEAFKIAHEAQWLKEDEGCGLILGDNLFFNFVEQIKDDLKKAIENNLAFITTIKVSQPERYGVYDKKTNQIIEKPKEYISNLAIPGFYYFPNDILKKVYSLRESNRNETEIVDLHNLYLNEKRIIIKHVTCGWFDAGTYDSLLGASNYVKTLKDRGELFY